MEFWVEGLTLKGHWQDVFYLYIKTYPMVPHDLNIAFGYIKYIYSDFGFFGDVCLPPNCAILYHILPNITIA